MWGAVGCACGWGRTAGEPLQGEVLGMRRWHPEWMRGPVKTHLAGNWGEEQGWAFRCLRTIPDPLCLQEKHLHSLCLAPKAMGTFLPSWAGTGPGLPSVA